MEQSPARMCATLFSAVGMETWYGTIYQSNIVVTDGPPEALTIKQVSIQPALHQQINSDFCADDDYDFLHVVVLKMDEI